MRTGTLLLFAFVLAVGATVPAAAMPPSLGTDDQGNPVYPICPTEDIWEQRRIELGLDTQFNKASCPTEGVCDDPATRDSGDQSPITINTIIHVINNSDGTPPDGVTQADVDAQMAEMNQDYASYGIQFNYTTEYHNDANYYCIRSYNFGGGWFNDIQNAKATYFRDTDTHLNILVTCQDSGGFGVLLGIATFPWDPDALTSTGGLWVNSRFFGSGNKTITHEVGHNLGLWHTHHGVDEVGSCGTDCREDVHSLTDPAADLVGDFCKDTQATPTNYNCQHPSGTDCNGVAWGANGDAVYRNFMGYGPDSCINTFSNDQGGRMHCWSRDVLSGWFDGGSSCTETVPSDPSSLAATAVSDSQVDLTWTDNSSNEDSFIVSRDGSDIATLAAGTTSYSDTGLTCETTYSYAVRASNCAGDSGTSTASATTGTCPAGPVVSVSSIDLSIRSRGPWTNGQGYVTVVDGSGSPVANAVVSADWSGSTSSSQTATTQSDGRAFFESDRLRNPSSYCWTLTVTDISLSGATYDAASNVETSDNVGNSCSSRIFTARDQLTTPRIVGNQPNPFNPKTDILFALPQGETVRVAVYDVAGRLIRTLVDGHRNAGIHSVTWNGLDASGRSVASGVYIAKLETAGTTASHRMVLVK